MDKGERYGYEAVDLPYGHRMISKTTWLRALRYMRPVQVGKIMSAFFLVVRNNLTCKNDILGMEDTLDLENCRQWQDFFLL